MITIRQYLLQQQPMILRTIKKIWGAIDFTPTVDPEDNFEFRYYDKLMRETPRAGR